MDPTAILMERATTEWTLLLASVPGVAFRGALGFVLLLASAVVLTALLPPREYPATGAHGSRSGEAMCPARVAVSPAGTGIAFAATVPVDVAQLATAGFSADETAALVALRRRVRSVAYRRGVPSRPTATGTAPCCGNEPQPMGGLGHFRASVAPRRGMTKLVVVRAGSWARCLDTRQCFRACRCYGGVRRSRRLGALRPGGQPGPTRCTPL